jgi:hypothetical protein
MEYNVFYMLGVRIRLEIYYADKRVHVDPCCFGIWLEETVFWSSLSVQVLILVLI